MSTGTDHARGDVYEKDRKYYLSVLSGAVVVFDEPSGAACMPGGLCPCGLAAGEPPLPVSIGPVQPCGCFCPIVSGVCVRPVLWPDLSLGPSSAQASVTANPTTQAMPRARNALRMPGLSVTIQPNAACAMRFPSTWGVFHGILRRFC